MDLQGMPMRARQITETDQPPSEERRHFDRRVGRNLRRCRNELGLTLEQAAAAIGVSFQQFHKYETGEVSLRLWRAVQISRTLNLTLNKLLSETPERSRLAPDSPSKFSLDLSGRRGHLPV